MSRTLLALPLLLLLACGASGDPADVTFAPELGVDLAAMEKRESGLYVQDLEVGTGAEAQSGMWVTTDYTGWLPDGTQFGATKSDGSAPFRFLLGVDGTIPGFEEGVKGMRVGGKRKLVVPAELGYGSSSGGGIPSNSVLVFEVQVRGAKTLEGGDPTKVTYAPELGVDLAAMEKRQSGLYVQDLAVGFGEEAQTGKEVTVDFTGWLTDGTQFDSSKLEGREPLRFALGQGWAILGFEEGLVGMRVGGKRKLVIPAGLGYGSRSKGPIPPNSVLVFELELLGASAQ